MKEKTSADKTKKAPEALPKKQVWKTIFYVLALMLWVHNCITDSGGLHHGVDNWRRGIDEAGANGGLFRSVVCRGNANDNHGSSPVGQEISQMA